MYLIDSDGDLVGEVSAHLHRLMRNHDEEMFDAQNFDLATTIFAKLPKTAGDASPQDKIDLSYAASQLSWDDLPFGRSLEKRRKPLATLTAAAYVGARVFSYAHKTWVTG